MSDAKLMNGHVKSLNTSIKYLEIDVDKNLRITLESSRKDKSAALQLEYIHLGKTESKF